MDPENKRLMTTIAVLIDSLQGSTAIVVPVEYKGIKTHAICIDDEDTDSLIPLTIVVNPSMLLYIKDMRDADSL